MHLLVVVLLLCLQFSFLVAFQRPGHATPPCSHNLNLLTLRRPLAFALPHSAPRSCSNMALHMVTMDSPSSVLLSVMDYTAEIENATVGTEVYTPIFQAGLSLFASGILAAFMAAFIISKSDSWEELGNEFERGKQIQLIFSDMPDTINTGGAKTSPDGATDGNSNSAGTDKAADSAASPEQLQQQKQKDLQGLDL